MRIAITAKSTYANAGIGPIQLSVPEVTKRRYPIEDFPLKLGQTFECFSDVSLCAYVVCIAYRLSNSEKLPKHDFARLSGECAATLFILGITRKWTLSKMESDTFLGAASIDNQRFRDVSAFIQQQTKKSFFVNKINLILKL